MVVYQCRQGNLSKVRIAIIRQSWGSKKCLSVTYLLNCWTCDRSWYAGALLVDTILSFENIGLIIMFKVKVAA